MEKYKNNNEKGITIIALSITIIVMIILAGISIKFALDDSGIISNTKESKEQYEKSQNQDDSEIASLSNSIKKSSGIKTGGKIETIGGNTETGENTETGGNTPAAETFIDGVKIPSGFVYVGGTKASGLVISDNEKDKEKYKDQTKVGTDLQGNQFVWVPVETLSDYKRIAYATNIASGETDSNTNSEKINYSILYRTYYVEALNDDEKNSVEKYKGYYIGRYEAGDKNSTEAQSLRTSDSSTSNSVTIKAGQAPYNYVTKTQAQSLAEGFAKQQGYTSKTRLCSSYAWDTAINFIEKTVTGYGDSSKEGNYKNVSFSYITIKGASQNKASGDTILVPTGQTTATNNIFDMGGNVMEWTTEKYSASSTPYTNRGGYFNYTYTSTSAGYRLNGADGANENRGFRITLFM